MARTSQRDLNNMAHHIENVTGLAVMIDWAYGAPRLVSGDGSREISPRLPSGQLMDWMRAFLSGYDAANRPEAESWKHMRGIRGNPAGQLWYPGGVAIGSYKMGEVGTRYYVIPVETTVGWDFVTLRGMFPENLVPDRIGLFEARLGYEYSGQQGYRLFKIRVGGKWSRPLPLRTGLAEIPGLK